MSLWSKFWNRNKIQTPQQLAALLASEADELTQRTIVFYTQAVVGREWRKLIGTAEFRAAMHRSRWETYPAILSDLVCIVESYLRNVAPADATSRAAIYKDLFAAALAERPIPIEGLTDAQAAIDRFPSELGRRLLAGAQRSDRIAVSGGTFLFDHLPIHESARENHKLPVVNAVRFAMVGFRDRLERRIDDPAALIRQMTKDKIDASARPLSRPVP
jgi:hypothetical protein